MTLSPRVAFSGVALADLSAKQPTGDGPVQPISRDSACSIEIRLDRHGAGRHAVSAPGATGQLAGAATRRELGAGARSRETLLRARGRRIGSTWPGRAAVAGRRAKPGGPASRRQRHGRRRRRRRRPWGC